MKTVVARPAPRCGGLRGPDAASRDGEHDQQEERREHRPVDQQIAQVEDDPSPRIRGQRTGLRGQVIGVGAQSPQRVGEFGIDGGGKPGIVRRESVSVCSTLGDE
jgi:hypothetical protein